MQCSGSGHKTLGAAAAAGAGSGAGGDGVGVGVGERPEGSVPSPGLTSSPSHTFGG